MSATTAEPKHFWPDGAVSSCRLVDAVEAGAQTRARRPGPVSAARPALPDLPMQKWYESASRRAFHGCSNCGMPKGSRSPRTWSAGRVERIPSRRDIVARARAAGHGQTWMPQFSMNRRRSVRLCPERRGESKGDRNPPPGFNAFWQRGTPRTLEILPGSRLPLSHRRCQP